MPHFDTSIQDVYTARRIAIHRVWHLLWRTHNNMLAHVAGVMEPELWFVKRCIKFIKMTLISENNTVCTFSNMGQYSSYSIMGANIKHFNDKYCIDERNMYTTWSGMCENNENVIRVCMQVKEPVDMRDKYIDRVLNRGECNEIIECMQSNTFTTEHAICIYFNFVL